MPFIHDESIVLPSLRQVNLTGGRVYAVSDGPYAGTVYPSITRMLKHKPKPALDAWRRRVGAEEAARVSARATVQGTALHKIAEYFLDNKELPTITPNVAEIFRPLKAWIVKHITKVFNQEADVFSVRLALAGRFDLLADVNEQLAVVDFKSAKSERKAEWVEDYMLQGTFYSLAVFELTGRKVKRIVIPIVYPGCSEPQVFECKPMQHFDMLLERVNDFYASFELSADEKIA